MAKTTTKQKGWLDNYGQEDNYNNSQISTSEGFVGNGYNISGRAYSPAWGGQFQMGGNLPGMTGYMYARQGAPSNGKYAKKTLPSAQNGMEMNYYQQGLDFKPKSMQAGGENSNKKINLEIKPVKENKIDSVNNEIMRRQLFQESRFIPTAYNKKSKSAGMAQVNPPTEEYLKQKYKLDLNLYDPKDAILAHKKLMTALFNRNWIDRPDATEEIKTAKSLAGYNMGTKNLVKFLEEQKKKNIDVYTSTDWVENLPTETKNYIKNITGKNPQFEEEYQKSIKDFKYKGAYPVKEYGGSIEEDKMKNGGEMIRRADGSYSQRGLWDNIRANKGSGKKPTKEMLKQESKIKRSEYNIGGVIKDDRGQWDHPGEITEIGSNNITMKGVPYPVLGISDTGHKQMMYPEQEYQFKGNKVTEYPIAQDGVNVNNKFAKKFNTKLNKKELESFNNASKNFPSLIGDRDMGAYDSQGYYQELYNKYQGDEKKIAEAMTPGSPYEHMGSDRFKKPNHPTFSNESKYHNIIRRGGNWNEEGFFNATRRNMKNLEKSDEGEGEALGYFKQAEDLDGDGIANIGLKYRGKVVIPSQKKNGGQIEWLQKYN